MAGRACRSDFRSTAAGTEALPCGTAPPSGGRGLRSRNGNRRDSGLHMPRQRPQAAPDPHAAIGNAVRENHVTLPHPGMTEDCAGTEALHHDFPDPVILCWRKAVFSLAGRSYGCAIPGKPRSLPEGSRAVRANRYRGMRCNGPKHATG